MKRNLAVLLLYFTFGISHAQKNPIDYINPIIGASTSTQAAKSGHGLGKTFPGSTTPFGLVQLSPDTKTGGDNGPGYSWHHKSIEGFSFIHMSGIGWYGDLGNFLVMPTVGSMKTFRGRDDNCGEGYRSSFNHDNETAKAGYYSVMLDDYNVRVELTSMPHSGILRMTYPKSDTSRIQIDLSRRIGGTASKQYVKIVSDNAFEGYIECNSKDGGWGAGGGNVNYTLYFYCETSKPVINNGVWSVDFDDNTKRGLSYIDSEEYRHKVMEANIERSIKEKEGKHLGFFIEFPTEQGEQVTLKAGISFVSVEGARNNLKAEIPHNNFEKVVAENNKLWSKAMENIRVEGATERDKTIFYTALYHTMIDPRSTSDISGEYIGADGKVKKSSDYVYRTIFSGWDVFRSQFPLQTIINPSMVNDEINSLLSMAQISEKRYLPRWEILNSYSGCMIGNPAVSVIADAYNKGIRNYNIDTAYTYCRNSVERFSNKEYGFSPLSISHTLEYAYSDWCQSELARLTARQDDHLLYKERSQFYKNIWNDSIKWFCGKREDGTFGEWRSETSHDLYCTESNPLQQGWFVPHDVYGFIDLLGHKAFTDKLTAFFDNSSKDFLWNDYYNHPNEPVHQVPFMFAYTGNAWLTQKWSRSICEIAYGDDVMGLCGNEDVGQMSAWYILASIGIHPVNPGDNIYIITSPVFDKVVISLDKKYYKGKSFTVTANNNSKQNIYIQSVKLNGKDISRAWLTHDEIVSGGVLELEMGDKPNKEFAKDNLPPSFGRNRWSIN